MPARYDLTVRLVPKSVFGKNRNHRSLSDRNKRSFRPKYAGNNIMQKTIVKLADFEVYDERSVDHSNVTLDIYIGVMK